MLGNTSLTSFSAVRASMRASRSGTVSNLISLSFSEHFPVLSQRFDLIDTNRDSFISREEFNQAVGN